MTEEQMHLEKAARNKERFLQIFREKITRDGAEDLLSFLLSEDSDFFTAPASSHFHGAYPGGLLEHSLNVYDCLVDFLPSFGKKFGFSFDEESVAIVALFHDLCKVNFYRADTKTVKKGAGWESVTCYTIDDTCPFGHGEKSVLRVLDFMNLSRDEAFAIRYHMGFSEAKDQIAVGNVGRSLERCPLAMALCVADMEAAYYLEGDPEPKLDW